MFAYDGLAYRERLLNKEETRRFPVDSLALYYGDDVVPEMLKTKNNYQGEIAMSAAFADLVEKLEERGKKEGREEGREEGIVLGKREVALQLKEDNYPFDAIVRAVKLDPQIVQAWLQEEGGK